MTILGTVYARDADVYFACNRVVSMMFMFADTPVCPPGTIQL
uniref:Uncharacterized protein n=1 Tax=Aegilops tauschii subsp. strangulata TaxID=200361 RepID=A0A452YK23_AEGTS